MRNSIFLFLFFFGMGILQAQTNEQLVSKGDVLILNAPSSSKYKHIDFPRKNFIIKRGAIANFSALEGDKVVVGEVRTENGRTTVVLKRKDGRNFFRFWSTVEADLEKALANGELILPIPKTG